MLNRKKTWPVFISIQLLYGMTLFYVLQNVETFIKATLEVKGKNNKGKYGIQVNHPRITKD